MLQTRCQVLCCGRKPCRAIFRSCSLKYSDEVSETSVFNDKKERFPSGFTPHNWKGKSEQREGASGRQIPPKLKENLKILVPTHPFQRQEHVLPCKHQNILATPKTSANTKTTWQLQSPQSCATLTHDGQDHHHEVEDVPPDGEVIVAQGEHLQHALAGEEDDEHEVDPVEDVLHLLALGVRLHHHGHHVEADEHHDDDVEGLLRDEVEDGALDAVLWDGRTELEPKSQNHRKKPKQTTPPKTHQKKNPQQKNPKTIELSTW